MELPDDVISLIKDYSIPVTRPDWRKLHIMTNQRYYLELMKLKDEWWMRDKLMYRRMGALPYDKLMRLYILRYRIHLLAEFEWE
jgi:hypothetical protein